ncbi:MAG: hypothetical protein KDC95_03860 [Planctomycetes bacterium]|nr:hypothetical protein [Planctomycetota bacterium]
MGVAHLPHSLSRVALALAVVCAGRALAQSTLPRDFERVHFARREAQLDRMFSAAGTRLRDEAMRKVRHAVEIRGWADSLSGTRSLRLAAAWSQLTGFTEADEACKQRFDWYLLALPEIVDTEKLERDRVRLGEIMRSIYPLLRPVVVADPDAPTEGRDSIHLTGRTVFGFEKPPRLRLRMTLLHGDEVIEQRERGDSDDPRGWMLYDLVQSFQLSPTTPPGPLTARMEVGRNESWPRLGDPVDEVRFWHAPGYHRRAWEFFGKVKSIVAERRLIDAADADAEIARLAVLQEEVLRPLLGRDYLHRSWPVDALAEGQALVDAIAARQSKQEKAQLSVDTPTLPMSGDRMFGVVAGQDELTRVEPLRVVWGPRLSGVESRLLFVLPPGGQDENYVIDGLGLDVRTIQSTPGAVVAFAHEPVGVEYIENAMKLLGNYFGTSPRRTSLAGILDGGTRARFAFPRFGGKLRELIFVGREMPDAAVLGAIQQIDRIRVVSAYGFPSAIHVEKLLGLPNFDANKSRLSFDVTLDRPRSIREALELVLQQTFAPQ